MVMNYKLIVLTGSDHFESSCSKWLAFAADNNCKIEFSNNINKNLLFSELEKSEFPYLVFVNSSIEPLKALIDGVNKSLTYVENKFHNCSIVASDGLDVNNEHISNNYYYNSPKLKSNYSWKPLVNFSDSYFILNMSAIESHKNVINELGNTKRLETYISLILAYHGKYILFSPYLSFCCHERIESDFIEIDEFSKCYKRYFKENYFNDVSKFYTWENYKDGKCDGQKQYVENLMSNVQNDFNENYISFIIRTQFKRIFFLKRLLSSISVAKQQINIVVEIILSHDIKHVNEEVISQLKKQYVDLEIKTINNYQEKHIPSRTRNLIGGIKCASGNFIWCIDDDDYLYPEALKVFCKHVLPQNNIIYFCGSDVHEENWDLISDNRAVLISSKKMKSYKADNWFHAFRGYNSLPICSIIAERGLVLDRISKIPLRHDLSEDYTLLLILLASKNISVEIIQDQIVGISLRKGHDNVVDMEDRSKWLRDIFSFLYDCYSSGHFGSEVFWKIASLNFSMGEQKEILSSKIEDLQKQITLLEKDNNRLVKDLLGRRAIEIALKSERS